MKVTDLIEHEDGSATVTFDMTKEETAAILESALRIALIEGLKMVDEKKLNELKEADELRNTPVGNP